MSTIEQSVPPSYMVQQRSTWHSPVPYLFGGLAAMLGLISFAIFILACSYWKLSGHLDDRRDGETDLEAGEANCGAKPAPLVMEEKFFVIMAGQVKPTFLATPMSSRASSFGSNSSCSTSCSRSSTLDGDEKEEEENGGQIEMGNMEAHEDISGQVH